MSKGLYSSASGFSLVEMAIVLVILGVALGGLLGAVGQSTENSRRIEARNTLQEIEEALYGFAQVQGRLPCPADDDTAGIEDVSNPTSGLCNLVHGMLPSATLGLSGGVDGNGLLMDPWGNPYRYSVAGATPGGYRYTGNGSGSGGIPDIFDNAATAIVNNANYLRVCDVDDCSGTVMSDVVPAVVISMGSNWPLIATSSANEQENASGGTTTGGTYPITNSVDFVVTDYSELNFDDMLVWISPHILLSKLVTAGRLP